jgi:hypothetical protein
MADGAQAVAWFGKAADQGQTEAQYNLGVIYVQGQIAPQDVVEGEKWLRIAGALGDKHSADAGETIGAQLSPQQNAEALKRATNWLAQYKNRK